jgi:Ca2+-binding RTX toxin-like protein
VVDSATDVVVESAGEGTDLVRTGLSTYTLGGNLENLLYTGSAAFTGTGNSLANILTGASGNDSLSGLGGGDLIDGGAGNDTMLGGSGDDTCVVNGAGDVVVENASEGTDLVSTGLATYTLGNNFENLLYTGSSAFVGTGNGLANSLTGAGGSDLLDGLAGADRLFGNAGNDTLLGGAGADTLSGGSGRDLHRFLTATDSGRGSTADVITDFNRSEGDRIDLSAIDALPASGSNDAFSFIGTSSFSGVAGQLRFQSGVLYADLNGDRASDFEIRLTGVTTLSASDLIL